MAVQARTCQLKPKIGIILGTTRLTRFSEKAAQWLTNIAKQRDDAEFEIVDLRDYPMPFFEEERSPMFAPPKSAVALRWGKKMAELDGYIFVTAEYNHGLPAVLKNALDYAYVEYNRKPATFVGYGSAGAARAVEQLRLVLAELQVATLKHTVHVNAAEFIGMLIHGKTFTDSPISASRSLQCWTIWCGGQMSLKPGGNRQRTQSPLEPDSSISLRVAN
jgi:NAD(P)H-dependent FMN reductase